MAEKPESSADNSAAEVMKEVIEPKVKGLVKWFNVKNGYGFVQRLDTKEDLFIHQSSITANNPSKARKSVGENENIEFAVAKGPKGLEAINVTGPDGTPVQGSRYARDIGQRRAPRNRNYSQSSQRGRPNRGGGGAVSSGGRGRQPRGGRMDRGPMRGPYMNYPPNFYPGPQGYMPEPGFPGNNRMMYYRQGPPPRNFFRPPGPGGYYFRSGPEEQMEGGYRQGRPRRGRGGRRNNRSQDRTESANMSGAGDQQQQQPSGRGRQRNQRRKRKSTNKSESEVEKNVDSLANGMKKMTVNGPDGVNTTA